MTNTFLVLFPQTSDQVQIVIFRRLSVFSLNLANCFTIYRYWRNQRFLRNKKRKRKKKHEFEMTKRQMLGSV